MISQETTAFAYLRLSREEAKNGESASIQNQRLLIADYCRREGLTLLDSFADDGYSGGNFERPAFHAMLRRLSREPVGVVLTKDLSRLGRDMREASYYAEEYLPERGVRYIAINDHFDTRGDNVMAPFQFAMNEVYLRDGSRKVRKVLESKRKNGEYCACPPYGYRKDAARQGHLVPDPVTAPVVAEIFTRAAEGASARAIARALTEEGVYPPLKYRALCRDDFSPAGAARAADDWNYTTVKRILKNQVYLGDSLLGKTRKLSVKSKKQQKLPPEAWVVTPETHAPLVSRELFARAGETLGRGQWQAVPPEEQRRSIFRGLVFCGLCGHALCSGGTVYRGQREKYWYLSCTHHRKDLPQPCPGVRIPYRLLLSQVTADLNALLCLDEARIAALAERLAAEEAGHSADEQGRIAGDKKRLETLDRMVTKLYDDYAQGYLSEDRLHRLVGDLEAEGRRLSARLRPAPAPAGEDCSAQERCRRFFALAQDYAPLTTLDRETLTTFVRRIEVTPDAVRTDEGGRTALTIRIFYRFLGACGPAAPESAPPAAQQ